jgi:hypothetical protein
VHAEGLHERVDAGDDAPQPRVLLGHVRPRHQRVSPGRVDLPLGATGDVDAGLVPPPCAEQFLAVRVQEAGGAPDVCTPRLGRTGAVPHDGARGLDH